MLHAWLCWLGFYTRNSEAYFNKLSFAFSLLCVIQIQYTFMYKCSNSIIDGSAKSPFTVHDSILYCFVLFGYFGALFFGAVFAKGFGDKSLITLSPSAVCWSYFNPKHLLTSLSRLGGKLPIKTVILEII